MSFLLRWLDLAKDRRHVGLRPHRDLALDEPYDNVYDRVLAGIDATLGAHVAIDDRRAGTIEAAFGLVNSERIRCSLQRVGQTRTAVRIEAIFPAGTAARERSAAVDALAGAVAPSGYGAEIAPKPV